MDKQKTQRIIGILVIIAFVIILIPLFFGKTEVSTQITSIKAPPLPEQQTGTTLAKADTIEGQTPDDNAIMGSATPVNNQPEGTAENNQPQPTPINSDNSSVNQDSIKDNMQSPAEAVPVKDPAQPQANPLPTEQTANQEDDVTITPEVADQVNNKTAPQPTEIKAEEPSSLTTNQPKAEVAPVRDVFSDASAKSKSHKIVTAQKKHTAKVKPVNLSSSELAKLTSAAWVVQMGNFKDKSNARRLADKLRAAGYKAFTKEIKSANGNLSTRVYVGPEFKQASALQLSNKVEQDMKMHGIVVSIKPLEI